MALATPEDVATRMGEDLDAIAAGTVEFLLDSASGLIADTVGEDDAWADELTPIPRAIRGVCVEMVYRVLSNPDALRRIQVASISADYRATVPDALYLTKAETRIVRRTAGGGESGAAYSITLETPWSGVSDDVGDILA